MSAQPLMIVLVHNSTEPRSPAHQAVYTCAIVLYCFNLILSIISLTFGFVSWTLLPNWRIFRHYVCMNLILASTFNMIGFNVNAHLQIEDAKISGIVILFIVLIPRVVMSHWLLVTTVMIYMDIVKGFNNEFMNSYLIANVFSWVVPFVEVLLVYAIDYFFQPRIVITVILNYVMNISLMVVSIIIYFVVVYNIIKLTWARKGTRRELLSKVIVATLCGIPSGLSTLMPILIMELMNSGMVIYNLMLILCLVSITAGHVVFLSLRANRVLWAEYRRKRNVINSL